MNEAFKTGSNVLKEANIMEISLNTFAQRNLRDDSPLHSYHRHPDPRMLCIFCVLSFFLSLIYFILYILLVFSLLS